MGTYNYASELWRKKQSDVMRLDIWVTRPRRVWMMPSLNMRPSLSLLVWRALSQRATKRLDVAIMEEEVDE
ncbi:hypothetical protein MKW98_025437 [Papaver atlanticum]|uniref:Uncharacterized protein n=1 Tax=Papaver atlanticum TaxID=357466 RepID=A0AAD4SD29_9MAGN|nr:hypothetical protein MKW98_025437 [Papaver atlanticum]